ncbi:MAG: hypothetical protein E7077_10835 [Bacteroidales bacterium]|jgi:hypothetical protein|nr:hypothetical protein [Bacteroidales bacterium]MEE1084912.1 hypothetical protein [Paludibacteraceae bacterium]
MRSELIVMLTHNDLTVENAYEIFEQCQDTKALYWGFKEQPLPIEEMKRIYSKMKECGKRTVLEVVAYTEAEGLEGAQMAATCGCDVLMGTCYSESIHKLCQQHNIDYMPFVGDIVGRPSILKGSIESMIAQAKMLKDKGVFGIDLLGYRYEEDPEKLISDYVKQVGNPVCVAGSIDSYERLQFIKKVQPWAFTIGSAFFENKFGDTFAEQINKVCDFINA